MRKAGATRSPGVWKLVLLVGEGRTPAASALGCTGFARGCRSSMPCQAAGIYALTLGRICALARTARREGAMLSWALAARNLMPPWTACLRALREWWLGIFGASMWLRAFVSQIGGRGCYWHCAVLLAATSGIVEVLSRAPVVLGRRRLPRWGPGISNVHRRADACYSARAHVP